MITIIKEFTKEQLIEKLEHRIAVTANYPDVEEAQLDAAIFKIALASLEAEPVSKTYNLPELIEGMEVSIDVSTCDADLGNRYFGTVTEALELDTAKNGYILLVQDAEPNFDVNGNSPVTPDSWISCSERMPKGYADVLVTDGEHVEVKWWDESGYWNSWTELNSDIFADEITHWMPLPEPPQEVNRG
ncbi:TPA: DUF551 domain-containing protein [Escherichia coli]|uniref:DUF551 domain-containing protein n=1 Tax=Escherichia coli TaxID=562 RepID=UPI00176A52CA|nr:DUF551 domain-containing protein [Escherichia coli]MBM2904471.1 DUF551 domain-containing protein [Escherichia coli]HAH3666051.1 DUF551 domain-containing protein [Escherichia coli]